MTDKYTHDKKILVLIMGGTINADHTKTKTMVLEGNPMTQIFPYRDKKGRLPLQILIEDTAVQCLGFNPFDTIEIADCDSKDLEQQHYRNMFERLDNAKNQGYLRVLVALGTDATTEIGKTLERKHYQFPLILITAMQELSRDMINGSFNHDRAWETDGVQNFVDALSAELDNGVHLRAHDGQYYRPSELQKDFHRRRFVPKV